MDVRVVYWKNSSGDCCQYDEYDPDLVKVIRTFDCCNHNFIAGLAATAYSWDPEGGDSIMEIHKKEGNEWIKMSCKEITTKYLDRLLADKNKWWIDNERLWLHFEGEDIYFYDNSYKFLKALSWVKKNVIPDVKYKELEKPILKYVL